MTIADRNITIGEFERLYRKNNPAINGENQSAEEYLEKFIDFKLKVIEAENLGLDTTTTFKEEFNKYRKELIKPYMVDSVSLNELLKHTYEKSLKEINASHILIAVEPCASPSDTLKAWNKIMDIRQAAINGEDFGMLATAFSDDQSAKTNKGNIGWFSAFRMVYEFEEAAYATPANEISLPVRTRFGYHIIKVHEIRPANGYLQVAHIFLTCPENFPDSENESVKKKIFSIKDSLGLGIPFEEVAFKYSEDKNSASNGGVLQWFSTGMMIKEFENAAFALKDTGEISEPFRSPYGWHIIKLLNKKLPGDFETEKSELLTRLNSPVYLEIEKQKFASKIKDEYGFHLEQNRLEEFYTLVDSKAFRGLWSAEAVPGPEKCLFTIGEKKVSMGDFAGWLEKVPANNQPSTIPAFVNEEFKKFSMQTLFAYEESKIETKYPELRFIIKEYHDGILLFELTEKMIWNKAIQDTAGLENYFNENYRKYKWDKRAEACIVTIDDHYMVNDAGRVISKHGKKKNFSKDFLLSKLCPEDTLDKCFEFISGKFEKGTNHYIDNISWRPGSQKEFNDNEKISIVFIRKILKPEYKSLNETRGMVISDYQDHLEKKWLSELRDKYTVKIYNDILSKVN